jgi:adenine-specific DNA methylase
LTELDKQLHDDEYRQAIATYLGLWLGRNADRLTTFVQWQTTADKFGHMFNKQSLGMIWDYAEVNPFNEVTGGASGQFEWIPRVIKHESLPTEVTVRSARVYCGDAARLQLNTASSDVVVTDPPYFDSMAYADLSDFFYVWLKRGLGDVFPEVFVTPQTPKSEEAVAHKHRHHGNSCQYSRHRALFCIHDIIRTLTTECTHDIVRDLVIIPPTRRSCGQIANRTSRATRSHPALLGR